ncbi:MAG TPA: LysR family transcriptional regulator [Chthonomonadaceae bacterium]|nr:LysR family transcriptional regulator [Chthonomonadaceae bacterium]
MELRTLRLFCDLVETQSFSRAAERSYLSQSAVSQKLRALEQEYGHVLIERGKGKGRLQLTEAGQILYEGAKPILSEMQELDARLRGLSDEAAGTVNVATVYSVGLHSLPGRLKPFLAAHPKISVHLEYSRTGKVYQDVLSGAVDVGIVACPTPRSGIEIAPFGEEAMVFICAPEHPLARKQKIPLRQLEGQPFIAFADDIPTRKLIDAHLSAASVNVRIVAAFDNIETIKNLVEIGSGVALVPENTVRQEAREGTLAVVPLSAKDAFLRPAGLLVKKSRSRRAAVRAFLEAIRLTDTSSL